MYKLFADVLPDWESTSPLPMGQRTWIPYLVVGCIGILYPQTNLHNILPSNSDNTRNPSCKTDQVAMTFTNWPCPVAPHLPSGALLPVTRWILTTWRRPLPTGLTKWRHIASGGAELPSGAASPVIYRSSPGGDDYQVASNSKNWYTHHQVKIQIF